MTAARRAQRPQAPAGPGVPGRAGGPFVSVLCQTRDELNHARCRHATNRARLAACTCSCHVRAAAA